jgi:hypothetical protein
MTAPSETNILIGIQSERIQCLIEEQAFLRSYDLNPPPPPPPRQKVHVSFTAFLCVACRAYYCQEKGIKGAEEEPNHTTARKPGPL